ncbi:hypothetical protein ES708_26552 [subsurface metagenome]
MTNRADWKAWNEERKRFLELESQGFESDIASLERHISKLQEVAPKDQAGSLTSDLKSSIPIGLVNGNHQLHYRKRSDFDCGASPYPTTPKNSQN